MKLKVQQRAVRRKQHLDNGHILNYSSWKYYGKYQNKCATRHKLNVDSCNAVTSPNSTGLFLFIGSSGVVDGSILGTWFLL